MQMFWECASTFACESYPVGIPNEFPFRSRVSAQPIRKLKIKSGSMDRSARDLHWESIVANYSRCDLTRATDKLIAISGVAKLIEREFNDEYLAGHWRSSLLESLL